MEHLLKISEFSLLAGINRKNLIFYDEIGLLSPERVMDNGYRFYSHRQLETVSVIISLQEVGMPLREIKQYLDERTPASLIELFFAQRKNMENKIRRLERSEAMIDTRLGITRRALEIEPTAIELRVCAEELLFAGDEIHCGGTEAELDNAATEFYTLCDREKITYGYPFGTMILRQNLIAGNWRLPSRFFFKMPAEDGARPMLPKPAGSYLIGYECTSCKESQEVYARLFAFAKKQKLAIAGNSYEEYLLDEITVKNPEDYLLQVSIQVQK